jgi:hypothetical protein
VSRSKIFFNIACALIPGEHTACALGESVVAYGPMKQYVVDELRPWEYEKIKAYLDDEFKALRVGGIYWIPLAPNLLTEVQSSHTSCHPLCFALDLEPNRLACELLVRTLKRVRCDCIHYATENQRNWLIRLVEGIFDKLGIIT